MLHLYFPFQLLRARNTPLPGTDAPGGSFDLKRGVGRDFLPEKLLQPQYAQPAVLRNVQAVTVRIKKQTLQLTQKALRQCERALADKAVMCDDIGS